MSKSLILHDSGIQGWVSKSSFSVDGKLKVMQYDSLDFVLNWVNNYASSAGGLDRLLILAHGYYSGINSSSAAQSQMAGGFGIGLGKDGLNRHNVYKMNRLAGKVKAIVIYSCSAAETAPGMEGKSGDGKRLMSEIAAHSGADVFASDETQLYSCRGTSEKIDFGVWEGTVYQFDPSGSYWPVN
jgi:hypothetical protein